ncbi:MAG: cation transporter [Pseudomonadota bacterium]|nr:cation transporter [Pseudomonadota bacterium]
MIKLKIEGMTCGHCAKAVENALKAVPGVKRVIEVDVTKGEAVIEGDAKTEALIAAVTEEGYEAELV